jgi:hypothetical protein
MSSIKFRVGSEVKAWQTSIPFLFCHTIEQTEIHILALTQANKSVRQNHLLSDLYHLLRSEATRALEWSTWIRTLRPKSDTNCPSLRVFCSWHNQLPLQQYKPDTILSNSQIILHDEPNEFTKCVENYATMYRLTFA